MIEEVKRILYVMPETAGDVLISTAVVQSVKKKYPKANIFFATHKQYADILEGNPDIKGVIDYDDSMYNYRTWEASGPNEGVFDMVLCPAITTQKVPSWIHSGHGPWLGQIYADACHVKFGKQTIKVDDESCLNTYDRKTGGDTFSLSTEKYITVHVQTRTVIVLSLEVRPRGFRE